MKHYVGIDLSLKESNICIMNENGQVVHTECVASHPLLIESVLRETGYEIEKLGMESGLLAQWIVQELLKSDIPAILICSRAMHALISVNINKTDRNDAREIADAMRINKYKPVHVKSEISVELSTLLNARGTLVRQQVTFMNTVRGLLKNYGMTLKSCNAKLMVKLVNGQILTLPEFAREGVRALLDTITAIDTQVDKLDKKINELAKNNETVKLLQTVPGIGPITALYFIAMIDDPERFENSRDVAAYVGLTPREFSSGNIKYIGKISKFGDSTMRCLLYEAGVSVLTKVTKWSFLKAWGEKIRKKHGFKKAAIAVGRKLCIIMHRMMLTKEPFKWGEPPKSKKQRKRIKNDDLLKVEKIA